MAYVGRIPLARHPRLFRPRRGLAGKLPLAARLPGDLQIGLAARVRRAATSLRPRRRNPGGHRRLFRGDRPRLALVHPVAPDDRRALISQVTRAYS